ncbi:MAG: hypothetical protein IPI28_07310 [Candidatus Omnitrophica bacterium]|nr:hypothetical protein [Candidatus Omnitrophota bacterium]
MLLHTIFLEKIDTLHKVSILPRGRLRWDTMPPRPMKSFPTGEMNCLGTHHRPARRSSGRRNRLGEITTGASNDLERPALAHRIV